MSDDDQDRLRRANEHWLAGRPLEAGEMLFEALPLEVRPKWASGILRLAVQRTGVQFAPIELILQISAHPAEWREAKLAFSALRDSTLKLEKIQAINDEEKVLLSLHYLAENVAKVAYNATNPRHPFDKDSGWWVAVCLKNLLEKLRDDDFSQLAWSALCSRGR